MSVRLAPRRLASVVAGALLAASLSACGGAGADDPAAGGEPAAAVDPSSDNAVTGPINRAKAVASAQEEHDRQVDQAGGGVP